MTPASRIGGIYCGGVIRLFFVCCVFFVSLLMLASFLVTCFECAGLYTYIPYYFAKCNVSSLPACPVNARNMLILLRELGWCVGQLVSVAYVLHMRAEVRHCP